MDENEFDTSAITGTLIDTISEQERLAEAIDQTEEDLDANSLDNERIRLDISSMTNSLDDIEEVELTSLH